MSSDPFELERSEVGTAETNWATTEDEVGPALERTPGILGLAWPAVLGNLGFSLVGFVDIKIVGSMGPSAVAAVTTGNRLFWIVQAVLIAVTAGTTARVARAWGAGDRLEADRVTQASIGICVVLAIVVTVPTFIFAPALAGIFDLDVKATAGAVQFIRVLSLFNVAVAFNMAVGAGIRAAGDTMTPLWIGLLMNILNIFLVYALVYGRLGFPEMGVVGAALANGLAFLAGGIVVAGLWLSRMLRIRYRRGARSLQWHRVRSILKIGYPAGLEQAAMQLGFVIFLWLVALYGTDPYAAYGIGVQILSFSFVVGSGFTIAASTHVGQSLGAGRPDLARASGWRAVAWASASMLLLGGIIIFFARPIAAFMIQDPEVVRLTVLFIYILGAVQPLMAIEFTLGGALRGAGDTHYPFITTLIGLVCVRGTVAACAVWWGLDVGWVFGALIFDYAVKATLLTLRFRSSRWIRAVA